MGLFKEMTMNRKILILIILCFCGLHTFAQVESKVSGTVTMYNSLDAAGNPIPVSETTIAADVLSGGGVISDSYGKFTIKFPNSLDREKTDLKVTPPLKYKDYVIVHKNNLKDVFIGVKDTTRISLCSQKSWDDRNSALSSPIDKKQLKQFEEKCNLLEEKVQNGEITIMQYRDSLKIENEKLENSQRQNKEMALYYAYFDPVFADSIRQEVFYYLERGQIDSALLILPSKEKAIEMRKLGEDYLKDIELLAIANGDVESAIQINDILYDETDFFKGKMRAVQILYNDRYNNRVHADSAFKRAEKVLKYAPNTFYSTYTYNLLGQIAEYQNKTNAHTYYEKAIKLYKKSKSDSQTAKQAAISYTHLANYYTKKNNYLQAESNYKKALNIYIELNTAGDYDPPNQIDMLLGLATIYAIQSKDVLVNQCIRRIGVLVEIGDFQPNSKDKATIDKKTGDFEFMSKNFKQAIGKYEQTLNYYISNNNEQYSKVHDFEIAKLYFQIGLSYKYSKDYRTSINYCDSALKKIDTTNVEHRLLQGFIIALKGKSYMRMNNKNLGKNLLNNANKIAIETKDKQLKEFVKKEDKWWYSRNSLLFRGLGAGAAIAAPFIFL